MARLSQSLKTTETRGTRKAAGECGGGFLRVYHRSPAALPPAAAKGGNCWPPGRVVAKAGATFPCSAGPSTGAAVDGELLLEEALRCST